MRYIYTLIAISILSHSGYAQESTASGNPFVANVIAADEQQEAANGGTSGSVDYAFDGGTLVCKFGTGKPDTKPHVAVIVYHASIQHFSQRCEKPIERKGNEAIVIISGDGGKYVQLTSANVMAWSKQRVDEMNGRSSSAAENSFVSAVVHALSNQLEITIWGADAQAALESGTWSKLFASDGKATTKESGGDRIKADPFK